MLKMNLRQICSTVVGAFFLVAILVAPAQGTLITIESGAAAGTTLDAAGIIPAIDISPHPAWDSAAPQWVSDRANTGDPNEPGFVIRPNGVTTFYHSFSLPIGDTILTSASLMVWADDTTNVLLNGTEIFPASTGPFPTCSANPIGCLETTRGEFGFADLAPFLILEGANQLVFNVEQANLVSYGLAYGGSFETIGTPEPASVFLVGVGMLLVGVMRRSRPAQR